MKITILGGTGFIGDYLLKSLTEDPENKPSVLFKNPVQQKFPGVDYYQIDSQLEVALDLTECLVILIQPDPKLLNTILGTANKHQKIVYASTLLLYPDSKTLQNEETEIKPLNDYEKRKAAEEKLLTKFVQSKETKLIITRIANVYGNIKNQGIIQKIFAALEEGETFAINNNGQQIRDYIFVEDVADYLKFLIETEQQQRDDIFNICTGQGYSVEELITTIEEITGKKLLKKAGHMVLEKNAVIGDNRKIVKASGFEPKYNLESGLKKTYQNYLKSKNEH